MARIDPHHPGYADFHTAVFADPRVTDIAPADRYTAQFSSDGGRTWRDDTHPNPDVCGGHVQNEVAGTLLRDGGATADGPDRTVTGSDGTLARWTRTR